jgi:hypothetical protein
MLKDGTGFVRESNKVVESESILGDTEYDLVGRSGTVCDDNPTKLPARYWLVSMLVPLLALNLIQKKFIQQIVRIVNEQKATHVNKWDYLP